MHSDMFTSCSFAKLYSNILFHVMYMGKPLASVLLLYHRSALIVVHQCLLQWQGSAGFHQCSGTTNQKALDNQLTRQRVVESERLVSLYREIAIPGLEMVRLDQHRAADQIKSVLAELKKRGQAVSRENQVTTT